MQTFRKNQIIITGLVILIAIAGYLNFVDNSGDDEGQFVFSDQEQQGDNQSEDATETGSAALVPNDGEQTGDVTADATTQDAAADASAEANAEAAPTVAEDGHDENVGEAILAQNVDSGFYLKTKIDREQARAKMMDVCIEVMNNQNTPQEEKIKAANDMLDIKERIEKEAAAEAMLEAKGFKDAYVRINIDSVDVVVDAKELNEAQTAQILDIVQRTTGMDPLKIVITPLNTEN